MLKRIKSIFYCPWITLVSFNLFWILIFLKLSFQKSLGIDNERWKSVISGSSSWSIFNFLRSIQVDFQTGCNSLQSPQEWKSVPLSPHLHQHVLSPEVLILVILIGVRSNLVFVEVNFLSSLYILDISPLSDVELVKFHEVVFINSWS